MNTSPQSHPRLFIGSFRFLVAQGREPEFLSNASHGLHGTSIERVDHRRGLPLEHLAFGRHLAGVGEFGGIHEGKMPRRELAPPSAEVLLVSGFHNVVGSCVRRGTFLRLHFTGVEASLRV